MKFLIYICLLNVSLAMLNVHDKMYVQLDATTPCVRRLNGTQSFGCTSSRGGNVGVIHLAYNKSELNWVLNSAEAESYIVGLPLYLFTLENLKQLNSSERITGVVVLQKESRENIKYFSTEDRCPNRYSGLAGPPRRKSICTSENPWNSDGSEIAMRRWDMPIFFTDNDHTISQIEDCFKKFNLPLSTQINRSLCALEMSSHMFASVNSATCLRRSASRYNINPLRYCDIMGGINIYSPLIPFTEFREPKKEYIIVSARLDSTSLFYGRAPGALSTVTSLVSLLLTAKLLFNMIQNTSEDTKKNQNVLFILFNGEAYDYIGSGRIVYDMEQGQFPYKEEAVKLENIALFVELSQLMNNESIVYHTYSEDNNGRSSVTLPFINKFNNIAKARKFITAVEDTENRFPPSSYQSFLAHRNNTPGCIFTSYHSKFQNRFYHSLYDDAFNLKYKYANNTKIDRDSMQGFVAEFSNVLAYSLFEQITGKPAEQSYNNTFDYADKLMYCFVETLNCEFYSDLLPEVFSPREATLLDYYVGVVNQRARHIVDLARISLTYLMAKNISVPNADECAKVKTPLYTYWIPAQKRCIASAVNTTEASSPAFSNQEYNYKEGYSSWTESSWTMTNVRMFLKPSPKYELLVFVTGTFIMVTSFVILFWISHNARELFNYPHLITSSNI